MGLLTASGNLRGIINLDRQANTKINNECEIVKPVPQGYLTLGHASLPSYDSRMVWEDFLTLFTTASRMHH